MLEFACVSVILDEVSDQSLLSPVGNQLAYVVLLNQRTFTFLSLEPSSVLEMRNWKLKEVEAHCWPYK